MESEILSPSANTPSPDPLASAPPALLPSRRLRLKLWLGLGGALLALSLFSLAWWRPLRSPLPKLEGDLVSWSSLEQKQVLAAYLGSNVRSPGFAVEVVTVPKDGKEAKRLAKSMKAKHLTYWVLAAQYKVRFLDVVGFNPNLSGLNAKLGESLLMPNQRGSLHQVAPGETLDSIEAEFKLQPGAVRGANRVGWLGLRLGQVLFLPGAAPHHFTEPMQARFEDRKLFHTPLPFRSKFKHYTSFRGTRSDPITGTPRHHNGVDIKAPRGEPVAAAAAGRVSFAGWRGGYGNCIIIEHEKGFRTLYGHLQEIKVKVGQKVKRSAPIGTVGSTGRSTGPHLHFTIWKNGKEQNPLDLEF